MINKERPSQTGFRWLLKMAWRDGKASSRKLMLFMASITMGIAAVVSIQSFGDNLKKNINTQSKSLMGADYIVDSKNPPNARVQEIMDSLGGADAKEIKFPSMAAFPRSGESKLVQVRGMQGPFPFYGSLETSPASAASTFQAQDAALVDATVMVQYDLKVGDSIKVGDITFPIAGALNSIPGSSGIFSSVAPPVLIPYQFVEKTGLIQKGSRLEYEFYFVAKPDTDLKELDKILDPQLDAEGADLDTHTSTSASLGRRYTNFGKFLNLVGFIALLLGCVGIASAINIYIKGKLRSVAVLKCLGATKKQTFLIFLLQIAALGLLGGFVGTVFGLVLQQLFPLLLEGLLPVDVQLYIAPQAIVMGLLLGLFMSVLFALYPLTSTLYVSPLQALRVQEVTRTKSKKWALIVMGGIFIFLLLFSFLLLKNWKYSLSFMAGIIVTFSILTGVASGVMKLIKKYFPTSWSFGARHSLLNLFRPNNQTLTLVLAIGIGTFLISTLYFTKDFLLAKSSLGQQNNSPNMILLDVQTGQKEAITATIQDKGIPVLSDIPIVTMRVNSINGMEVNTIRKDSTTNIRNWILNHEFRVTYRDSLISSEKLSSGNWVSNASREQSIPISISDNFARDAKVEVGDKLTFNVQGLILNTIVGSIRAVDWGRMQPNFSIVFPLGILEEAPQFRVLTTKVANEEDSASLQRELVKAFPNVSILDLRQILSVIEGLLNKISWIINFMAFFSILTGIIVLLGAVRTSKYQRLRESVLLRTIGAKTKQILKIVALEYLYLGVLGGLSGILLSLVSSQLLAWWVFETTFTPSSFPFLVLFPSITILVLTIGLLNSRGVIKSPPLEVLRKESR